MLVQYKFPEGTIIASQVAYNKLLKYQQFQQYFFKMFCMVIRTSQFVQFHTY